MEYNHILLLLQILHRNKPGVLAGIEFILQWLLLYCRGSSRSNKTTSYLGCNSRGLKRRVRRLKVLMNRNKNGENIARARDGRKDSRT